MNERWLQVDSQHYWHAFTQMAEYQPLIIDKAEGVWLYDVQGNRYLDGVSSMWCNVHGHCHPYIDAAIGRQLAKVAHVTSLGMSNPTTIQLTEKLLQHVPAGLETVFYSCDGASAVEVGLKLAFQYWRQCSTPQPQRDLFLAAGEAYHGDTLGAVSIGGVSRFHAMFQPLLFDVMRGPCPDSYRLPGSVPPSGDGASEYYLDRYRHLMQQFGHRVAAVVIEPLLQGAAGMVIHPPGFLAGLAALAKEHGTLLIADEIAVGMGRTGKMWACQWEQVCPDILVSGKGLTGGYLPMSATLTNREIWNAFLGSYDQSRSFFHGHTYGGNPLASAAALACLELFEAENTLENVRQMSAYLRDSLECIAQHRNVGDIRLLGLAGGIEIVADKASRQPFAWQERVGHRICKEALGMGVWIRPLGNVIVLMPPLCISREQVDHLVAVIKAAIARALD